MMIYVHEGLDMGRAAATRGRMELIDGVTDRQGTEGSLPLDLPHWIYPMGGVFYFRSMCVIEYPKCIGYTIL